jgi:hypothetical protein
MMFRANGFVERSGKNRVVPVCARACWLALAAAVLGCSSDPDGSDPVADDTHPVAARTPDAPRPSAPTESFGDVGTVTEGDNLDLCEVTRTPISDPDVALLHTLDRLEGSYPIGGDWAAPVELEFSPKETPFEGELVVRRRDGQLVRLGGCAFGVEVPVAVTVRTKDGALAESVEGIVLLDRLDELTVDGTPAPFRGELSAQIDAGALSGSFTFADDPAWGVDSTTLRAELTPFGTRGMLGASIQPNGPPPPIRQVSPMALQPLLTWHGPDGCVGARGKDLGPSLFPAPTDARAELDATLETASAETYRARYADGTETRLAIDFEPLSLLCATNHWAGFWHFPTRVHLKTDDGRIDVSIGVSIDPGFARLHYNELTEVPWAYPPARVDEQIGHLDAALSEYAHVGIESWFDVAPEPAGWIKVFGYDDGACGACDASGGCSECAYDQRQEVLTLFIGTQPSGSK